MDNDTAAMLLCEEDESPQVTLSWDIMFESIGHANCSGVPPPQHCKGEEHTLSVTVAQCASALDP